MKARRSSGRSQAVRLPAAYRFDVDEVFVRRDERTGDIILSRKPADWSQRMRTIDAAKDDSGGFLADRVDLPARQRDPR